jgi:general secretion pathway protein I
VSRTSGFTLIEVLAALAIVTIGMGAVLLTLGSSASTAGYLRDKTLAQWVALNQIEATRLAGQLPAPGTTDGKVEYAGREWHWRQEVTSGEVPGLYSIEVSVQEAGTPQGDQAPWIGSALGAMGDAVAPPRSLSLYHEYSQLPPGAPSGAGTSTGIGAP